MLTINIQDDITKEKENLSIAKGNFGTYKIIQWL
jgi:hypothetical protein